MNLHKKLTQGCKDLNLELPIEANHKILDYLQLLSKWNKTYNLTAIKDPEQMLIKHVFDCLVLLPYLGSRSIKLKETVIPAERSESRDLLAEKKIPDILPTARFREDRINLIKGDFSETKQVLDVGTGAGLPGIILAICLPEFKFVLLDGCRKKITFLQHIVISLKLTNVEAVHSRIENYSSDIRFDWVISRAFASIMKFVELSGHLCANHGHLLAMKGKKEQEFSSIGSVLPGGYCIVGCQSVVVPKLQAERCLVFVAPGAEEE
jgi:16S rRNA (guanine527-N7)-methyltransferase